MQGLGKCREARKRRRDEPQTPSNDQPLGRAVRFEPDANVEEAARTSCTMIRRSTSLFLSITIEVMRWLTGWILFYSAPQHKGSKLSIPPTCAHVHIRIAAPLSALCFQVSCMRAPCRRRVASTRPQMTFAFQIFLSGKVRFRNDEG